MDAQILIKGIPAEFAALAEARAVARAKKDLVAYVLAKCPKRPPDFEAQVNGLLLAGSSANLPELPERINNLVDSLDTLLMTEKFTSS